MDAPLVKNVELRKSSISQAKQSSYPSNLKKLDRIIKLFGKAAFLLAVGVIFSIVWVSIASATSIDDIFMVPVVKRIPSGAAIVQPQTGAGYAATQNTNTITGNSQRTGTVQSSNFAGGGVYSPPKYDAFSDSSMGQRVDLPTDIVKNVEEVDFTIYNDQPGTTDRTSGTTNTTFTFKGSTTSRDFNSAELEYRWDFENDSEIDSYFSHVNSISHMYSTPGVYDVKMEVLDGSGRVHRVVKSVYVVKNTAPKAVFKVDKVTAPENSVFRFETALSADDQYTRHQLKFRFDWDGDGVFDTNFQGKTVWNHLFRDVGSYDVVMEAIDPEGATDTTHLSIEILQDSAPTARFSVEKMTDFRYKFDASASTDDYSPGRALRYRWDFNYAGKDDIVFDTGWSSSPKFTGSYRLGGSKMIRLQVKDEQGFIDETFAKIDVPWPEEYVNLAVGMVRN